MSNFENIRLADWGSADHVCLTVHGADQPFYMKLLERDPNTKRVAKARYEFGTYAEHASHFASWRKADYEAFVMLGLTDGRGHSNADVTKTWALGVDHDGHVDIERFEHSPYRPSLAIQTSDGRHHFAWILTEPIAPREAEQMLVGLAIRLHADLGFANLSQTIRLPGFANSKYGTTVSLLPWSDGARTYSPDDLQLAFDIRLALDYLRTRQPRFSPDLQLKRSVVTDEHLAEDLKSALTFIPADEYKRWTEVGLALQGLGESGFDIWNAWSRTSKKYDPAEAATKWRRLKGKARSISFTSIFALAAQYGWKNPGFRHGDLGVPESMLSDRVIGRLIAAEMRGDFAVASSDGRNRSSYNFLRWEGGRFVSLDAVERRQVIESCVRKVRQDHANHKAFVDYLDRRSASNRAIDDLAEHAAEFLIDSSSTTYASSFPYLPVKNGVLNLLRRELVPTEFRPLVARESGVTYDPDAKAELFLKTLGEIFEGDVEMVRAILRLFGYILLGNPKEHILVVLFGPSGRNGKTLLVLVMREVFGAFAQAMPSSVILAKSHNNESATPALASLVGKRLAIFSEPSAKHPLDSGFIKLMTGGEQITARALHADMVEFMPEFTPVIVTNKIPAAPDDDQAFWRRMKIIKFTRSFSDEEIDVDLKKKLAKEASGILNLLLDGIQDYIANGLSLPEKVKSAGVETRNEFDPFEAWLEECTTNCEAATETKLKELTGSYEVWSQSNRQYRRMSKKELSAKLVERGYSKTDRRNYPCFAGITLKDAENR